MLAGTDIMQSYGRQAVLHSINIAVHPGKITCLIGPSGSGKTTLIKTLSLLEPPRSGRVTIDSQEFFFPNASKGPKPWPKVTVVFQQHFLWPHLTLRENILLPARRNVDQSLFNSIRELFDMNDFIERYPNEVSLGQRQRAAIARALLLKPSYLLLDEITSALDIEQTSILLKHLLSLRGQNIGILIVTHALRFAKHLVSRGEGDQVVIIDKGHVLEVGGPEIFEHPTSVRAKQFMGAITFTD